MVYPHGAAPGSLTQSVCLSVCLSVTLCIVAKRYILPQKCLNSEEVNRKCPLRTRFYNYPLKLPISCTTDVGDI